MIPFDEIVADAERKAAANAYRLWVSADRCVLFRLWDSGTAEVAVRPHPSAPWGPPFPMAEGESQS